VGGLSEGVEMGAHAIDSGKVSTLLIEWAEASHVHTPSTETK
jgi:hypothetical protein